VGLRGDDALFSAVGPRDTVARARWIVATVDIVGDDA
jgi:hypothetical protein